MATATAESAAPASVRRSSHLGARLAAWAGPALIVASVLVVLHDFAFRGMAPSQQNDVLSFWLPSHCFLGQNLLAGNIPDWNQHVMGGVPFAADPQSGWMYLPAMALYAALPCDAALPSFIVLQPLIAGLATYWFLRTEALSRPAATVGGLLLSLAIAASRTAVSLPVAGTLAWSAVLLGVAARYLRAGSWSARLGWAALGAVAWGQVAAAHLSHGLAIATGALIVYGSARSVADVRAGRRGAREAVALGAVFLAVLVPVNLAYLLPRLGYLPRSSLGLGYQGLLELTDRLTGASRGEVGPRATGGYSWPLRFSTSPGAYLGAVPLALSFAALASQRHRALAVAAALTGGLSYLVALPGVARTLAPVARAIPLGDVYLHAPGRFRYGVLLSIPVLAAVGVDAWRNARTWRGRVALAAPGAAVWWLLPLAIGVRPSYLLLLLAGAAAGTVALLVASRRAPWLALLPVVVAVELGAGALLGQAAGGPVFTAPGRHEVGWMTPFYNLLEPDVDPSTYLRAGPVARALRSGDGGRYLTLQPSFPLRTRGYIGRWSHGEEALMDNQRAILFGAEDAQGYNPVQLRRYWVFTRRVNPRPPKYNLSVFPEPLPVVLDLMQVRWIVAPGADPPAPGFTAVVREGPWTLFRGPPRPRASVVTESTVVPTPSAALEGVLAAGFDPESEVVLEDADGLPSRAVSGAASGAAAEYRALGPDEARVDVRASAPAMVVIRNPYDRHWSATVDGRPAEVRPADYLLQAVAVPPGEHAIRLIYRDPWVRVGLAGTGISLGLLAAAAAVARRGPTTRRSFRRMLRRHDDEVLPR